MLSRRKFVPSIVNSQLQWLTWNLEENLLLPLLYSRIISNCILNTYTHILVFSHLSSKVFLFCSSWKQLQNTAMLKMQRTINYVISTPSWHFYNTTTTSNIQEIAHKIEWEDCMNYRAGLFTARGPSINNTRKHPGNLK